MKLYYIDAKYLRKNGDQLIMKHNCLADTQETALSKYFTGLYPMDLKSGLTLQSVEIAESKMWDEDIINLMVVLSLKKENPERLIYKSVFNVNE